MPEALDPLVSLAFSLRSSPGVYAVLLGSGMSRAAGIPTGWELVLDLVKRIAAAHDENAGDDPERWYADKYGKNAGYSDLLDILCRTPAERQQLLKGYFEPTDDEREQGLKLPTAAHHAVAELMEMGLVRVVVTTNFDRLLEQVLEQRGIVPTVIASADQAVGMIPLTHQKHCVIKIHGDYLDTRILNTEAELSSYQPAMQSLVDRVFDEFGMIVCGWSATWDLALRASIERSTNRRFACFWGSVGDPTSEAKALVLDRRGVIVPIKSADSFFERLLARVRGLEEFERPHPISVQAAIGAAKRYLADDAHRIRLHDLYQDAVREAKVIWDGEGFPSHGQPVPDPDAIAARVKAYDASAAIVIALTAIISRWSRGDADDLLVGAIGAVGRERLINGTQYVVWSNLRHYPGALLLYSTGMGSLIADRPALFSRAMLVRTPTINNKDTKAVLSLNATSMIERENLVSLFGGQHRHVPLSDWLHDSLREAFRPMVADDEEYTFLFDTFEFYLAMAYRASVASFTGWAPLGSWGYRSDNYQAILAGLGGSAVRFGGKEFAEACPAMFTDTTSPTDVAKAVSDFRSQVAWY